MIEISEYNVYEVRSNKKSNQFTNLVKPVKNKIWDRGFEGQFYNRGTWGTYYYSFVTAQVIRRVCHVSEMKNLFPEDFI